MGCRLQASADFLKGGRLGRERRPTIRMLKDGLYTYVASDAHYPKHYTYLAQVVNRWGDQFENV